MSPVAFIELTVRIRNTDLTPVTWLATMRDVLKEQWPAHEIEAEIGEHTGACSSAFCDQAEQGWH